MNDQRTDTLEKSSEIIKELGALIVFFEDATLMNVYLQTQIIHKLFEDNEEIDISKLELFHLQFTTSLIALMSKIRQKNERAVGMYRSEIELNNQMIDKVRDLINKVGGFEAEKLRQVQKMSKSLRSLYTAIYNRSNNNPFTEDISSFSIDFYKDYFFESTREIFDKITTYDKANTFRNPYTAIDKQLLIALGQANFNIAFFAGVNVYPMLIELYKIQDQDIYFFYWPSKNLFLPCDIELFPHEEWMKEMSKKSQMIKTLIRNNQKAEANIKNTYRYISHETLELLEENYKTITNLDFLASLEDINTQANILKSMLDTKLI